jgi:Na+-driven multidrug efflux pump
MGVAIGCTTRVGTLLGEGEVYLAKLVTKGTVAIGAALILLNGTIVYTGQETLVGLFTKDQKVVENCAMIWSLMTVDMMLDNMWAIHR